MHRNGLACHMRRIRCGKLLHQRFCRHHPTEEPHALAGTCGSVRGAQGNLRSYRNGQHGVMVAFGGADDRSFRAPFPCLQLLNLQERAALFTYSLSSMLHSTVDNRQSWMRWTMAFTRGSCSRSSAGFDNLTPIKHDAQLICWLHNSAILDELEKEEMCIVEKGDDGATSCHCAADVKGLRRK